MKITIRIVIENSTDEFNPVSLLQTIQLQWKCVVLQHGMVFYHTGTIHNYCKEWTIPSQFYWERTNKIGYKCFVVQYFLATEIVTKEIHKSVLVHILVCHIILFISIKFALKRRSIKNEICIIASFSLHFKVQKIWSEQQLKVEKVMQYFDIISRYSSDN